MLSLSICLGLLAASLLSLYGWGRAVGRWFYRAPPDSWAFTATLGMLSWMFLGGVLNALSLAFPAALDALFAAGLLLCVVPWATRRGAAVRTGGSGLAGLRARLRAPGGARTAVGEWLPVLIVLAVVVYWAATLMPARVFNHHDDLHKYFVPPVRMLATGTLGGNPFDTLGYYHLGVQSFLQAFIVNHFPISYIHGFDALLCFLLAGLLVNDIARRAGAGWPMRALAVVAFTWVTPQYVNATSVYSGALVALALIPASTALRDAVVRRDARERLTAAVPLGMLLAALVGLKSTLIPYAALYAGILLASALLIRGARKAVALAALAATGAAAAFLAPWLAATGNRILGVLIFVGKVSLTRAAHRISAAAPVPEAAQAAPANPGFLDTVGTLFSSQQIYFGHHFLDYGAPMALLMAALAWMTWRLARHGSPPETADLVAVYVAAMATALYFLAIPFVFTPKQGIRYLSPIIAAMLAVAAPVFAVAPLGGTGGDSRRAVLARMAVAAVSLWVIVAIFSVATLRRVWLGYDLRTNLSYISPDTSRDILQYFDLTLTSPAYRGRFRDVQGLTEPGTAILVYTGSPFLLDFARNRIDAIPDPQFTLRWEGMPFYQGDAALKDYLLKRGVRYILWEFHGWGIRQDAELRRMLSGTEHRGMGRNTLQFRSVLAQLALKEKRLFDDNRVVLIDLDPGAGKAR